MAGWRPIHHAAHRGDSSEVQRMTREDASVVHLRDDHGATALLLAACAGQEAVCVCLLDGGARPGDGDADGWTPLLTAASMGHVAVVRLLLERGADVACADKLGNTPLMEACARGSFPLVDTLVKGYTQQTHHSLDAVNYSGRSALCFAAAAGDGSVMGMLLDAGADPVRWEGRMRDDGESDSLIKKREGILEAWHKLYLLHKARRIADHGWSMRVHARSASDATAAVGGSSAAAYSNGVQSPCDYGHRISAADMDAYGVGLTALPAYLQSRADIRGLKRVPTLCSVMGVAGAVCRCEGLRQRWHYDSCIQSVGEKLLRLANGGLGGVIVGHLVKHLNADVFIECMGLIGL